MKGYTLFRITVAMLIIVSISFYMHQSEDMSIRKTFSPEILPRKNEDNSPLSEHIQSNVNQQFGTESLEQKSETSNIYMFNASNIKDIKITRYLSHGVFKLAFLGKYKGLQVAVRVPTGDKKKISKCIGETDIEKPSFLENTCDSRYVSAFLREIYLLHRLRHPNIARLLGYCFDCEMNEGNSSRRRSIVVVTEYNEPYGRSTFLDILHYTKQLSDLFYYFENSPLGSLWYGDLHPKHFLLTDSGVKMIDIDQLYNSTTICENDICRWNITCDVDTNTCPGFNAIFNMVKLYNYVLRAWLDPYAFPEEIRANISSLKEDLRRVKLDISQLGRRVQTILDLWQEFRADENQAG